MKRGPFLQKSLIIALMILSFASLGLRIYLDGYFYSYSPREPIPAEGKLHSQNVHHGTRVYLTRDENLVFELSPSAFIVLSAAGALLNERWKWLTPDKRKSVDKPAR